MSHNYMYISSLLSFPCPCPIPPLQVTKHQAGLPMLYSSFPLAIYFTHDGVYTSTLLSIRPAFSFPHCVYLSILYTCICIPSLQSSF